MAENNAAASAAAPAADDKKSGKGGMILPIALVVLVLNAAGFAGIGFMLYKGKQKEAAEPTIDQVVKGEHEAQAEDHEKEEEFVGKTIPLETFLVNLAESRGRKLLKVDMELEIEGEKVQEEIEKRKPQIRDIIIILLSSKTYGQVSSSEGKEYLKEEIRDTVNSFLTKGKIKRVMFTNFIYNG